MSGVELRNRNRSYSRVSNVDSDNEPDDLPLPFSYQIKEAPSSSGGCAKGCFFFSLAGAVFLSSVALMLSNNSVYFTVSKENEQQKPKLAEGVTGAVLMYVGCAFLSGWYWYRHNYEEVSGIGVARDPRFED